MTPVLSDSQVDETIAKFKKILEDSKAEIVYQNKWKLRKLAYPIQKKSTGMYQVIEFKAAPSIISNLEREYRLDDRIIRFLTIALDKHGVEYNIKKRETTSTKEKEVKEENKKEKKTSKKEEEISAKNNEKDLIKSEEPIKESKKEGSKEGSPESV